MLSSNKNQLLKKGQKTTRHLKSNTQSDGSHLPAAYSIMPREKDKSSIKKRKKQKKLEQNRNRE